MSGGDLPAAAYLVGLAGLPGMGPRRLRVLLAGAEPSEAWGRVLSGRAGATAEVAETLAPEGPGLVERWRRAASQSDLAECWRAHRASGIQVLTDDDDAYPEVFRCDLDPPPVLFAQGELGALAGVCVAVVGTRRCTQYGRDVASDLGRDLTAAGVAVVSGLALGIDAAAHAGALSVHGAPPVGVVANGVDVLYPPRNARLYRQIAERGLLVSEYPMGAAPRTWSFPARNRLVAAAAKAVVVVESRTKGGSHYTVEAAINRGVEVMVVPGSVRSPASAGTNKLLTEGCSVARDALDVLVSLGIDPVEPVPVQAAAPPTPRAGATPREVPVRLRGLLDAIGWEPASLEQLLLRTHLTIPDLHAGLSDLEGLGLVVWQGNWVERRVAS